MSHQEASLGKNRTGTQMSPILFQEMLESAADFSWESLPVASEDPEQIQHESLLTASPVGSIPLPLTLKGAVMTGYEKLKGGRPEIFVDKLGERLAFERMGVRLYSTLIRKCEADPSLSPFIDVDRLKEICQTEHEHMLIVRDAAIRVGADPTAVTPAADTMAVAFTGINQVLADPRTSLSQCLEAILIAELADRDGWSLLIELAESMDDATLLEQFNGAYDEEKDHVDEIRLMLKELTLSKPSF